MALEIGIGILGFGTVGAGVVRWLRENGEIIEKRTGIKLILCGVADIDLERDRGVKLPAGILTRDAGAVIANPKVQIVIELIGGIDNARKFILQALKLGKPVVTANKALLAENAAEIFQAAEKNATGIFFEASVGGGIPIVRALRDGLVSNRVKSIYGILNGTCNYVLTRMEQGPVTFAAALKEAQKEGFAETNPALDIDGIDTAHKAIILASLAYGLPVPLAAVSVEGIRGVSSVDMQHALDLGYCIKLLAVIEEENAKISVRVHPTLVPKTSILASVSGVFNAVLMKGDGVGEVLCYGMGAGRDPTASAILSDVVEAARDVICKSRRRISIADQGGLGYCLQSVNDTKVRYYLRLTLLDKPGMFGQVGAILGRQAISIASVLQKENNTGRHVPIIIVTHHARENAFRAAIKEIDSMAGVGAKTVCIRIEDF